MFWNANMHFFCSMASDLEEQKDYERLQPLLSSSVGSLKSSSSANFAFSQPTLTAPKQQRVSGCSF
jgi:hypothetical protein